jgi:hypothetical protein
MQHPDALIEVDPIRNVVHVNEYEYDGLKTDEARAAAIRVRPDTPIRTI